MLISIDTSLLAHGLNPSQMTSDGRAALRMLREPGHEAVAPLTTFIEFTSTVLKLVRRGIATAVDAQIIVMPPCRLAFGSST